MKMNKAKLAMAVSAALTLCSSAVVQAENVIETMMITASKKQESIQASNVAVTAFSGDMLRELNLTDSTDIASQTPGLNIGTPVGEGNNPSISLRGVGLNDFNDNNFLVSAKYCFCFDNAVKIFLKPNLSDNC